MNDAQSRVPAVPLTPGQGRPKPGDLVTVNHEWLKGLSNTPVRVFNDIMRPTLSFVIRRGIISTVLATANVVCTTGKTAHYVMLLLPGPRWGWVFQCDVSVIACETAAPNPGASGLVGHRAKNRSTSIANSSS